MAGEEMKYSNRVKKNHGVVAEEIQEHDFNQASVGPGNSKENLMENLNLQNAQGIHEIELSAPSVRVKTG